jgi:hypothetical protein
VPEGYSWEEKVHWHTFGLTGLYKLVDPDPIELDVGLRFQLHSATWDIKQVVDELESTDEEEATGWSFGPLARARWYFADGAVGLGPEMYLKYTSLTYKWSVDDEEEPREDDDLSSWDIEYSLRLEFFF